MITRNTCRIFTVLFLLSFSAALRAQPELKFMENISPAWKEVIGMYRQMDKDFTDARLLSVGATDIGKDLHLFVISKDHCFTPEKAHKAGQRILFINNGIHPGESCGIDASLKFAYDLLSGTDSTAKWLEHTTICIVPVFNVGGAMNRGAFNRANQNGPEEQGFRGNARNLDLNRDFIKLDSKNAASMVQLLQDWKPDLFIDTHTSNGADYQYTITLIATHPQKLEAPMSSFQEKIMLPWLYRSMEDSPYEMIPYVANYADSPDKGIEGFMDYPRYTSGYVSLFNSYAFTVETHMFKAYPDRVLATWEFLRRALCFTGMYGDDIQESRMKAQEQRMARSTFVLEWAADTTRFDTLLFKGYEARHKPSIVTGYERLYYDRSSPWEREIRYYNYYKPVISIEAPETYIIPSGWTEVISRLELNGVQMYPLKKDSTFEVQVYYIEQEETMPLPYNGHYWHHNTLLRKETQRLHYLSGDLLIPVHQPAAEYIVQVLEPQAYDSFFSWNFFDPILSRKEYFSPYIFEETAEALLEEDPVLKAEFDRKIQTDSAFSANAYAQLRFIYEHSPYSEKSYRRYPVARIEKSFK